MKIKASEEVLDTEEMIFPPKQASTEDSFLEKFFDEMKRKLHLLFSEELLTPQKLIKRLPLLKWVESKNSFAIYLLCNASKAREISPFFRELIIASLENHENQVVSTQQFTFPLSLVRQESIYFEELLIQVDKKDKIQVQKTLSNLAHDIKAGVLTKKHIQYLIGIRNLPLGDQVYHLFEKIITTLRRYPKAFGEDLTNETHYFLVHFKKSFRELHDTYHLFRMITTRYLFRKALLQDITAYPGKRHLYFKLYKTILSYPFGEKKVLGMTIALNSLQEYEYFEPKHILKVIQRIIPGVRAISDSNYSDRDSENHLLILYLEIEKVNGEEFTLYEFLELKRRLKEELKNGIEYLSPSIFSPRNEEDLFRNIIQLSSELKYVGDLPQATISFQEQKSHVLRFNIILLRLLSKNSRPLAEASRQLLANDHLHVEKVAQVGRLRKKHIKEATLFSLEIPSRHFLRKNHSVDLLRARSYVVKSIERLVGPFRDYNGGFLLKQNEQLSEFKRALGERAKTYELAIENLFYSLFPSVMQTILTVESGKVLFSLFLDTLHQEISKEENFLMLERRERTAIAFVIKTEVSEIKERLLVELHNLAIDPLKQTTGFVNIEGYDYLTFLLLNPKEEEIHQLRTTIKTALSLWTKGQMNLQVLRFHLPRSISSLDPRMGVDRTSGIVIKMLYEGLMRINREGKVECALALKVDISDDGKRYLFQLKKTLWSNGAPLTAYDFEYAWKKILDPLLSFPYASLFFSIKNAKAAKQGLVSLDKVGISALNDKTLLVELENENPHFLDLLAHWTFAPLSRENDLKHPGWAYQSSEETYICNGPFKLNEWQLNGDLELIRNPLYWNAPYPKLDSISIHIVEEEMIALNMFDRGLLDWMGDPISKIPLKAIPRLQEKKRLFTSSFSALFWLQLNVHFLPFKTAKLRQAFSLAISRKALIENILKSKDLPAFGFRKKGYRFHEEDTEGNRASAFQLFEEGLKELNIKKEELPPILFSHSDMEEQEMISREVGKMWEETFGITVTFERLQWHHYIETLKRQDYIVGGVVRYPRYHNPNFYLELLASREDETLVTNWENNAFSTLINEANQSIDPLIKEKKISAAEQLVCEEMPVIPLLFQHFRFAKNPRLQGIILSENGWMDFREACFESSSTQESEPIVDST